MGVDAVIWAKAGSVTREQVEQANAALSMVGIIEHTYDWDGNRKEAGVFTYYEAHDADEYGDAREATIGYYLWDRYFGPWYRRGHWPTIARKIDLMGQVFPDVDVVYTDDSGEGPGMVCNDTNMAEMWGHWNEAVANANILR